MIPLLMMIAVPEDAAALYAAAKARLAVEQRCAVDPDTTDVTVCGLRRADRFRVPFVVHDPGDPRHEGVPAERVRLLNRSNPIKDLSPFLVHGGMAGVSVGVTSGSTSFVRKPAP